MPSCGFITICVTNELRGSDTELREWKVTRPFTWTSTCREVLLMHFRVCPSWFGGGGGELVTSPQQKPPPRARATTSFIRCPCTRAQRGVAWRGRPPLHGFFWKSIGPAGSMARYGHNRLSVPACSALPSHTCPALPCPAHALWDLLTLHWDCPFCKILRSTD